MQTNDFAQPGTSLTASVAMIPWLLSSFRGMIVGLWHDGHLYRFATYTGAQIEHLEVTDDHVSWTVRDRTHRLAMRAVRVHGATLRGPSKVAMGMRVPESLQSTIEVRLTKSRGNDRALVFEGKGRYAGLEVAGDLERLLS